MNQTAYKGIDYGLGQSNVADNGIRYGVISQYEVGQFWYEESEAEYGKPFCPTCFNEVDETSDFSFDNGPMQDCDGNEVDDDFFCTVCEKGVDGNDPDIWPDTPLGFYYNQDGYQCSQSQDDTDIFITKSPYFTYAQFCSPCAPGAVYLMNPLDHAADSNKGYCFGHDWFESGKAPYPVYSVETGKLV